MNDVEQSLTKVYPTIVEKMVNWYAENHEVFPWRASTDPYRVWVSEIMLQQTTVRTVVPYYEKFMARFPSVEALAAADIEEVLIHWQGLGYYRRARMLHKAAQVLVEEYQGVFPKKLGAIKDLPGIGDYTAKAIASIALKKPVVPVDGNVIRVVSRLFAIKEDPAALPKVLAPMIEAFEEALTKGNADPGDFAQSLMDLGREVCKPQNPSCANCPVQTHCQAFALGKQDVIPLPKVKPAVPTRYAQTVIVRNHEGQFLIEKRPFKGVLHDLWQFPTTDFMGEAFTRQEHYIGQVVHVFSHFKLIVDVYVDEGSSLTEGTWIHPHEMQDYAFSTLMRKIFALYHKSSLKKAA